MVRSLNSSITGSKKFSTVRYPVAGSLARSTGQYLGVHSFTIEHAEKKLLIAGWAHTAVKSALRYLGIQ